MTRLLDKAMRKKVDKRIYVYKEYNKTMQKCPPKLIIKEVPDVQTVILPNQWFDVINYKKSVFVSLYEWMLKYGKVPSDNKDSLHNRTYIGEKLYKKLIAVEKKRIKKHHKLKGEELNRAVSMSDINLGPKTDVGGCKVSGDVILVVPKSSLKLLDELSFKILKKTVKSL